MTTEQKGLAMWKADSIVALAVGIFSVVAAELTFFHLKICLQWSGTHFSVKLQEKQETNYEILT